jgi:hypothetical protein
MRTADGVADGVEAPPLEPIASPSRCPNVVADDLRARVRGRPTE